MIAMSLNLLSIKIRGRHSTTDIPYKKYTIECIKKASEQLYIY